MPRDRRRVVWAPQAKRDLREVRRYYARVASQEIADQLLREISQAGELLSQRALIWRRRDEIAIGLRSVLVRPYVIFYRMQDDKVEIARVLHGRRNLTNAFADDDKTKK
jgi:toxin ParE1/3/4